MGVIADELNPVREFTVAGATFKARQISFMDLLLVLMQALTDLGVKETGLELEAKAQECIGSGSYPRGALKRILAHCAPDLDEADVSALMLSDTFVETVRAINWMVDGSDSEAVPDATPSAENNDSEDPEKKRD